MQSVASNAVASLLNTDKNDNGLVDITSALTMYMGVTGVNAFRFNNMVYMYINGSYTGSPTTSTQSFITNIPAKYRPRSFQSVVLLGYNTTQYVGVGRGIVYSDGTLTLGETNWLRGTTIRAGFVYMI